MISAIAELNATLDTIPDNTSKPDFTSRLSCFTHHLSTTEKQRLLSRFGSQSSAYFTLQPGVKSFGNKNVGYISYRSQSTMLGRVNIVFCDPVCAQGKLLELIEAFLQQTPGKTIFMGISKEVALGLRESGYHTNQMGTEFSLKLNEFQVKGKDKKHLRHSANLGNRHGLTVKELEWGEIDQSEVHKISNKWREQKAVNSRELKLLTRPPEFKNEWKVRKFYCFQGEQLLGYVFFDPYFKNEEVIGYCANIIRKCPQAKPSDLLDYTILEAIKTFRAEGIEQLSLGISPLYNVEMESSDRPALRVIQNFLFNYGNSLYAFKPLAYHKTRYRGDEEKWYLCTKDISTIKTILAVLQGTQLISKPGVTDRNKLFPLPAS